MIGAMLFAGNRKLLATVVNEFASTYPNASVRVASGNSEDMLNALRVGEVDFVIGLSPDPAPEGLVIQPLAETLPLWLRRGQSHPLVRKPKVTLDDLSRYEWVIGMPGARRRVQFGQALRGGGSGQSRVYRPVHCLLSGSCLPRTTISRY